ncbi:LacI family DNA-binding transcriptional regulator [Micromonospora sp. CB01531]|uniref:LacI family DNA-binding transcriptional regulator n=1 Tax=Micromonospora sp. CB01531 TaxID=1718947 RepID=UPI00093FBBA2|nr:LacI family DNA-binding transcriptional regulator [Micromonospora sp. CB01531]
MTRRLAEVARYVGVSEATVSRVLNGKPGISDATRASVLTALDVLGYERPSKLRGERARLVGLVLPELQNPIFPAFAEVVGEALAKRGLTPVLCTRTVDGLSEADYVDMLLDQQVSGVIFAGGNYAQAAADHGHYQRLLDRRLPVVLVNAGISDLKFPTVATDDAHAVDQAYAHLTTLGHERIGLILGPRDHVPSSRKLAAFQRLTGAVDDRDDVDDSPAGGLIKRTIFSMEGGHAAATRLIKRGATGLICASDVIALGAVRAVRRLGMSVPGDVSVVGYDDSAFMACTDPPLTTIRQPIDAMGQAAVKLLVSEIAGNAVPTDELVFEPELVVRGSTGAAPSAPSAPPAKRRARRTATAQS